MLAPITPVPIQPRRVLPGCATFGGPAIIVVGVARRGSPQLRDRAPR